MPKRVSKQIRDRAMDMYVELREQKQEVVLIPAPEQRHVTHSIRVVQVASPEWYSRFRRLYPRKYPYGRQVHPQSSIRRRNTLRGLHRLSNGDVSTDYAQRLLRLIKDLLKTERKEVRKHKAVKIELDEIPF
jgi:hypothetical protein